MVENICVRQNKVKGFLISKNRISLIEVDFFKHWSVLKCWLEEYSKDRMIGDIRRANTVKTTDVSASALEFRGGLWPQIKVIM